MHAILYPPGHKRAGQKKADKDLTDAERQSQEDSLKLYHGYRCARAKAFISRISDAEAVMNEGPD